MSLYAFEVEPGAESAGSDVVSLGGELDLTNARELEERLLALRSERSLVVDLDRVTFIDSAALHVLFTVVRSRPPGLTAFVLDPASGIARTIAIVKLEDLARLAASRDELGLIAN